MLKTTVFLQVSSREEMMHGNRKSLDSLQASSASFHPRGWLCREITPFSSFHFGSAVNKILENKRKGSSVGWSWVDPWG